MRHLSVPSAQTSYWIQRCKSYGWYATGHRVQRVGDETAIPLSDDAPDETDSVWENLPIIERDASEKKARYYWEHIPSETRHLYNDEFPQAFETQGDVLLVKIPEEMALIEEQIAQAMLRQFPSIRVVCHDEGVEGEFRVRNLRVLKARNDNTSTQTQYREHGHTFLIDPAIAYFSTRLGTQRMRTFEAVSSFQEKKERPLVIVDPYAGVGPSMALLYTDANLVSNVYVNDMNPEAIPILQQNMERFHSRRKHEGTYMIECMDARKIADERPEMMGCADVLLVNLPHDSIAHLQHLFPLLSEETSLVCGWSIQERSTDILSQLQSTLLESGRTMLQHTIEEVKGFSTTKAMFRYEFVLSNKNKR